MDNNYFDKDTNAYEWYKEVKERVVLELFHNQRKFLYMYGELGNQSNPVLKDGSIEFIESQVTAELGWLISNMTMDIIDGYRRSNIDMSEHTAEEFNNYFVSNPSDYVHGVPTPQE